MRSKSLSYKKLWKKMKENAIKNWPLWAVLLFVGVIGVIAAGTGGSSNPAQAAGENIIGLQLTDNGQGSADCSHRDQDGPLGLSNIGAWTPWTGDSDSFDADCIRLYLGNSIPPNTDIQIGLQAQDVNTPCGFMWLGRCGDGGGAVVWGPWVADQGGTSANVWTGWATDADGWDPDQWRIVVNTRGWYGHTISSWRVGVQVADMGSGGGCSEQIGTTQYTQPSTSGPSYSPWAADNVDNQNFNCARINLIASAGLNNPTAAFIGTSTAPYGTSVNLPWDVEYIDPSAGCTITSPSDSTVRKVYANGFGSTTTVPIVSSITYTMTCHGLKSGSTVVTTKTISTIPQPASLEFHMSPISGLNAGDTSTASISAINAASCTLVGKDSNGNVVDSGYTYVPPPPMYQSYDTTNVPVTEVMGGQTSANYGCGNNCFRFPYDLNSPVTIQVVGGGGNGGGNNGAGGAGGGGGGGYAASTITYAPGAQVGFAVGGGGGGTTWFDSVVGYGGGGGAYNANGGVPPGGGGGGGVGQVVHYGGSGGGGGQDGSWGAGDWSGGGGGGAGGASGNGGAGAYGGGTGGAAGGAGGGYLGGAGGAGVGDNNGAWGGTGGAYGGGGGGAGDDSGCSCDNGSGGGAGQQGIIVVNFSRAIQTPKYNTKTIVLPSSGTSWVVPSDWNSSNNSVELWGGGGGGGGDGSASNGYDGTATIFNGSMVAGGGRYGLSGTPGSGSVTVNGGTASGGNSANTNGANGSAATPTSGGAGGSSPHGGSGGARQTADANGNAGIAPGGGGSGACTTASCGNSYAGGGGGGGAYVKSTNLTFAPGSTVTYQIGTGGAGGPGDRIGGVGADGKILVTYSVLAKVDNTDVHTSTHTITQTTDYTVTCIGFDNVPVSKSVHISLNGCLLDGVTIPNNGSANFYSYQYPPAGHTCSEYGPVARICTGGQLDTTNAAYKYASCIDQSNLTLTANGKSPVTSVRKGSNVALAWDGGNSSSCTLTGTDGYNGRDNDGTTPIKATKAVTVNQKVVYTLSCALGNSTKTSTVTVNILPTIIEN